MSRKSQQPPSYPHVREVSITSPATLVTSEGDAGAPIGKAELDRLGRSGIEVAHPDRFRVADPPRVFRVSVALDETWDANLCFAGQHGRLVIERLEVHVRPADLGRDERESGTIRVPRVPEGGLAMRTLRRLTFGAAQEAARDALREIEGDDPATLRWHGFSRESLDAPRRPGRKRRPDRYYAEIAATYVHALGRGSRHPVVDVARELSAASDGAPYPAEYVRDALHAARKRGLLTSGPPGLAGGELTDKARATLANDGGGAS